MNKFKEKLLALLRGEKVTGGAITALFIGAVIVVNAIIYALTTGYGLYYIPSGEMDFSISGSTDSMFEKYEGEKVDVIFCKSSASFNPEGGDIDEVYYFHNTAKEFEKRYPGLINIDYVNVLTKRLESDNSIFDFSPYQEDENGEIVYPVYDSSVIFESNKRNRVITDISTAAFYYNSDYSTEYYSSYHGEEIFASMVSWVLADEIKNVYFTTFHGETSEIYFANMLTCAGYQFDTIDLRKNNIPEDADLVVISNPTKDFEKSVEGMVSEITRLEAYVKSGGNLYVSIDPYANKLHALEEFLSEYGIEIAETEKDGKTLRNIVKDNSESITTDNFTLITKIADSDVGEYIFDKLEDFDSGKVCIRECAALNLTGRAEEILVTSSSSSVYAGEDRVDNDGNYCVGAISPTANADGTRNGNIFVISSVYLTANDALTTSGYGNRDFLYALMDVAFDADAVPYGCEPYYMNTERLENLTMRTARIYTLLIMVIPVAIAICGAVVVIKRKNR